MLMRRRLRDRSRGQALVEFALILPIFILLLVGIFDFGRAIYAYNTIANAARESVRVGIVDQNTTKMEALAIRRADALALTPGDVDVAFLNADLTNAAPCNVGRRIGCVIEVTVRYRYQAATPILGNILGVINLQAVTRQQIERSYTSP